MQPIRDAETLEFDRNDLERAAAEVHAAMNATPQYCWPLLSERAGCELWVKHENCTPVGAFKIRGGITYFNRLSKRNVDQVVCATRGNHGISIAFNARRIGVKATVFVPRGNSVEKNAAMRSWGAEVIENGEDFQQSLEHAADYAAARHVHFVPSFDAALVAGVASLGLEFLSSVELDIVYAPIGLGSGLAGLLAVRKALNLRTEVVGVVATGARAYAESMRARHLIELPVSTFADGMACRTPNAAALEFFWKTSPRVVEVDDEEIAQAMRMYFFATHHVAEPAGAASLAAAMKDPLRKSGKRIGVILSGGNVDTKVYSSVLRGQSADRD
jgi:threonine dehydratase